MRNGYGLQNDCCERIWASRKDGRRCGLQKLLELVDSFSYHIQGRTSKNLQTGGSTGHRIDRVYVVDFSEFTTEVRRVIASFEYM